MTDDPESLARNLVDQHYAAGPDQLKAALAKAFAERDAQLSRDGNARKNASGGGLRARKDLDQGVGMTRSAAGS